MTSSFRYLRKARVAEYVEDLLSQEGENSISTVTIERTRLEDYFVVSAIGVCAGTSPQIGCEPPPPTSTNLLYGGGDK